VLSTLYSFRGGSDSANPTARVVVGPDGSLSGTTQGLHGSDFGSVFSLRPPATFCRSISCPWTKTVIFSFTGGIDGDGPGYGDLIFGQEGSIYGTTIFGGAYNAGTVFKLARSSGGWTETVLYSFTGQSDGLNPYGGVVFDNAGNLYGTTLYGGDVNPPLSYGYGVVFKLTPSGSGWTESSYMFQDGANDGGLPFAGPTIDSAGNLYGTASVGGDLNCSWQVYAGCGTVFQGFAPSAIYSFTGSGSFGSPPGPEAQLAVDAAGDMYGTTLQAGANRFGSVFKLAQGTDGWTYTSLHDFNTADADPLSSVAFDSSGNLYGTASYGGAYGAGVVWEITP